MAAVLFLPWAATVIFGPIGGFAVTGVLALWKASEMSVPICKKEHATQTQQEAKSGTREGSGEAETNEGKKEKEGLLGYVWWNYEDIRETPFALNNLHAWQ